MRIAFVHQNYPGQFVHLAPALAARGHGVLALTASTNENRFPQTVAIAQYAWRQPDIDRSSFRFAKSFAEMTHRGEVVAAAALELRNKHGFMPDLVFGTPGWGETLFLREIWPTALHLMYGEFFYGPRGRDVGFDPEFYGDELPARMAVTANAAHLLVAMNASDRILSPTRWQGASFPDYIQERITIIHDGIDTERVSPKSGVSVALPGTTLTVSSGDEILTFINRNLEPHRGYHIFMRALPKVLAARPNARVVIIGNDEASYSPRPRDGRSWKEIILSEVRDRLDMSRVHFVGRVPHAMFVDLMRLTRVHAYLSYPFVLSWSMMEAMSAGALVIGSRTPPVEEMIQDGVNGRLVGFFDVHGWSEAIIEALGDPARFDGLRHAARETITSRYDLKRHCLPRLIDFVESLAPQTSA